MKLSVQEFAADLDGEKFFLVIGKNGSGKEKFLEALEKHLHQDCEVVSLERAAEIIQYERENDESEYVKGGVDIGRTGKIYILQAAFPLLKKDGTLLNSAESEKLKSISENLENCEAVKLCGVQPVLNRGLKYMSTGEIRRIMLARALFAKKRILIVSNPFEGLDVQSRKILFDFFENFRKSFYAENSDELKILTNERSEVCNSQIDKSQVYIPQIIFCAERWSEIPKTITHVLEFSENEISFYGKKSEYEKILQERKESEYQEAKTDDKDFLNEMISSKQDDEDSILVQMKNVNVSWGENHVLKNLSWVLHKGEHYLVRGPNGSGKTTFLELITGDNKQVYSNEVYIFGIKRGSGETIWDIKKNLGIVSYRIHVEYRMLHGISLRDVVVSGFYDSIGLYERATEVQISVADKWLSFGGFGGRENESFANLSYGEQRAVLILRAVVKNPKILILDEPCHGLDENYRQKILSLMNHIGTESETTMLHVTHDETEILDCEKNILELCPTCDPMYKIIKAE